MSKNELSRDMRKKQRILMIEKDINFAEIGRSLGVARQTVAMVANGKRSAERVREALIAAGIPEELLPVSIDNKDR